MIGQTLEPAAKPAQTRPPANPVIEFLTPRRTLLICAGLIVLFGLLSFTATLKKSATYDEPLHVVGGYMHKWFKDYRINPEDPALFGMWAALPHSDVVMAIELRQLAGGLMEQPTSALRLAIPSWDAAKTYRDAQWIFTIDTMYWMPANDPDALLRMSRSMFTWVGVILAALTAWWSWKLAGSVAAVTAAVLFAFDPNISAHSSLVKNDVSLGLLMLALGYVAWHYGRVGKLWRLIVLAGICGAAMNTKFSGVLFGPIVFVLLSCRAVFGGPWRVAWINLNTIGQRMVAVVLSLFVIVIVMWGVTWAVYGFRYSPLRDGGTLNTDRFWYIARYKEVQAEVSNREGKPRFPTAEEVDAHPKAGLIARFDVTLEKLHLLPQAWTFGFLYTYATTQIRSTYLLGNTNSITGWWYYFPLAMLFKTPTATIIAAFGALGMTVAAFVKRKRNPQSARTNRLDRWTFLCLLIPPGIYMLAAMTSNLNLGLRHILPVYPYIFVGIAVCAARLMQMNVKRTQIIVGALALLLAVESVTAYPNYLPFFNLPFRPWRFKLLGDSNLDWGQDLLLLRDWYEQHNDKPLYLSYFGTAEPKYYGIEYVNLGAGNALQRQYRLSEMGTPGYVAISATNLQAIYHDIKDTPEYKDLRESKPLTVLGGTIYVYEWNPKKP